MRMRRTNLTPGKYRGSRPVTVRLSLVGSNALSLSLLSTLVNFLPAVVLLQFGASNSKDAKSRILGFCTRGSFGLEVSGGQRKFPGGQDCSKVFLGSRLNWQAEALRARFGS